MALCIFNCEWLRDRPGDRAFRCTWDKKNYVGIKAAVLFTNRLHCMHWHACVARSVLLVLTLLMTQTTRYECVCCEVSVNNAAHSQVPFRFPRSRDSGPRSCQKQNYAGDKADQHHGGWLLRRRRSRPSARLGAPTDGFYPFL